MSICFGIKQKGFGIFNDGISRRRKGGVTPFYYLQSKLYKSVGDMHQHYLLQKRTTFCRCTYSYERIRIMDAIINDYGL